MISKAEMTCPGCGAVRLVSKKTIYNNGGVNIKRCLCCAQKDIRKQRFEKKACTQVQPDWWVVVRQVSTGFTVFGTQ